MEVGQQNVAWRIVAMAVMVVGCFLFHAWFRTQVVARGYQVSAARQSVAQLESELAAARAERQRLMGAPNLTQLAEELKQRGVYFRNPEAGQVFYHSGESEQELRQKVR